MVSSHISIGNPLLKRVSGEDGVGIDSGISLESGSKCSSSSKIIAPELQFFFIVFFLMIRLICVENFITWNLPTED